MFNLANKLTLLRMLLVPLVIVLLYFQDNGCSVRAPNEVEAKI